MFKKVRYKLLLSYLGSLGLILLIFASLIRIFFIHSLTREFQEKLIALGEGAAANAKFENGHIKLENEFSIQKIIKNNQALQWFDTHGHLLGQQGKEVLNIPLFPTQTIQFEVGKDPIQAVTLPIIGSEDGNLIGYVRASQSLKEFDAIVNKLDWGLGGGIVVALFLSGVGGVWLTRQAMQPIEESFQRIKSFTADASHELRSPLMAIKSNAAVALKYPEGMRGEDAEKFQAIVSATNQMTSLTEDLLFLARNDKIPYYKNDIVNLTEILENLVQLYKPQAEVKQIELESLINKNIYLLGDVVQLTRLFRNLIDNSLCYTASKGRIEIKTNLIDSDVYVKIQDTGIGIAPENLEKVFERFWRADKSRSYNTGGSGLGLAIAQIIVQNHGGSITVTSQLGVGSCFTVCLPMHITN